jgi:hypothetical protein
MDDRVYYDDPQRCTHVTGVFAPCLTLARLQGIYMVSWRVDVATHGVRGLVALI